MTVFLGELEEAIRAAGIARRRAMAFRRLADREDTIAAIDSYLAYLGTREAKLQLEIQTTRDLIGHGYPELRPLMLSAEQGEDILLDLEIIQGGLQDGVVIASLEAVSGVVEIE